MSSKNLTGIQKGAPAVLAPVLLTGLMTAGAGAHGAGFALEEVIVTAQKRQQSLQDVPVAVTALGPEQIEANGVVNVNDINGLAPNMTVRPAVGGTNTPAFSMRGITSYGVVPGSDKQISIYLDGVYIGSSRGSISEFPDIDRLEVLRGPQGTLFGRNATGGAISVETRDPDGEFGLRQKVGIGSRDYLRTESTIDFPALGDFKAYVTYTTEEQDGDIKNLGAGTTWDRTAFGYGVATSPKTLGSTDNEAVLFSSIYEPSYKFSIAYKFDYSDDKGSPRGNAILSDLYSEPPQGVPFLIPLWEANPDLTWNGKVTRPDKVNNAFSTNRDQKISGHTLTGYWEVNDELNLKNILAYRKTEVFSPADISGTSGWLTPGGVPFCFACSQSDGKGDQWSDELQLIYDGDFATVTTGLMYFESHDEAGGPPNSNNTFLFATFPDYIVPAGNQSRSVNDAKSYAAYNQTEFHITDELDLIGGLRFTRDDKSGTYITGSKEEPTEESFKYKDDHVDYLVGVTYQLAEDIMVYAKYSTAYVSGGSVASFEFDPEEAESFEIGGKADFWDGRIRTNLALFDVTYDHLQTAQSGLNVPGASDIAVLVVEGGKLEAQGVELEFSMTPWEGWYTGFNFGYQDVKYAEVSDLVAQTVYASGPNAFPNSSFEPTLVPEYNGALFVTYESQPLFGSAYINAGLTAIWQDEMRLDSNPGRAAATPFGGVEFVPDAWNVIASVTLRDIQITGDWTAQVGLWGRNLTDEDHVTFATNFGGFPSGDFVEERSYGVDLVVRYK